ncbi:16536_t:CDS:1, partial [Racocetra persica]
QLLIDSSSRYNITEATNPEYHKPKGHPPKQLKSFVEESESSKQKSNHEQRTCSYCLDKGYNIHEYTQYKADLVNKEN